MAQWRTFGPLTNMKHGTIRCRSGFNSRGYEDVIGNGKKGFGEVLENSTQDHLKLLLLGLK